MGWNGYYAFIDGKGGGGWYDDYGYVWGPKLNVKNTANPSGFEEYPQYNSPYDPNQLFAFTQSRFYRLQPLQTDAMGEQGKRQPEKFSQQ